MGQISITENTLANINQAIRDIYNDQVTRNITQASDAIEFIDTEEMWSWAKNDGGTYLHLYIDDSRYLDVSIFVKVVGTLDWGDGSLIETCSDSATTYHTHTYATPSHYVIKLNGNIVLGTSSDCMFGSDAVVKRYLQKIEIGANTTFSSGGLNAQNASYIYFSDKSLGCSGYDWRYSPFVFMYINKVQISLNTYGMAGYHGCKLRAIYGDGCIKHNGIHAFRETSFYTMDKVVIDLADVSSNSRYFPSAGAVCSRLRLKNPLSTSQGIPNSFVGSYYYLNLPSNLTAFNDNTSSITILSEGELHCQATTPPTLRSGSITCQTGAKIYVPIGCLETYQAASNWAALADYMQEEPS